MNNSQLVLDVLSFCPLGHLLQPTKLEAPLPLTGFRATVSVSEMSLPLITS